MHWLEIEDGGKKQLINLSYITRMEVNQDALVIFCKGGPSFLIIDKKQIAEVLSIFTELRNLSS